MVSLWSKNDAAKKTHRPRLGAEAPASKQGKLRSTKRFPVRVVEGRHPKEARMEIARIMRGEGESMEKIMKYTRLTAEEPKGEGL